MGRPSPLLTIGAQRAALLAVLLGIVSVWPTLVAALAEQSEWFDVALAAFVVAPLTLAAAWVALPLADDRLTPVYALIAAVTAIVCDLAGFAGPFNAAKLLAYVLAGYAFLRLLDTVWPVVLIACLIPWVDALSVAAGPTKVVVEERPDLFERIAVAFPLPGGSAANIGPPDVFFLALFLACARRDALRVGATFVCSVALLGLTLLLTVAADLNGLPALPAVSLGFLLPNADLLWRRWRMRPAPNPPPTASSE